MKEDDIYKVNCASIMAVCVVNVTGFRITMETPLGVSIGPIDIGDFLYPVN